MLPLFEPSEVREVDNRAITEFGIPSLVLMENAAVNSASIIRELTGDTGQGNYHIFCGKGNNGGDGYAIARQLADTGRMVFVYSLYDEEALSPDAKTNFRILLNLVRESDAIRLIQYRTDRHLAEINPEDIIIDAILGSGSKGELQGQIKQTVKRLNKLKCLRISIDNPTGLDCSTGIGTLTFNADYTISLFGLKQGLFINDGVTSSGNIIEAGIGLPGFVKAKIPARVYYIEPEDISAVLPVKKRKIHKYSAGKVLHIASSVEYPGAGALCSAASFYAGAGASILCAPASVGKMIHQQIEPTVVVRKYEDSKTGYLQSVNLAALQKHIDSSDCIVIGPGLGTESATAEAVIEILKNNPAKRFLIDADALRHVAEYGPEKVSLKGAILTPHMGEFSMLTGSPVEQIRADVFRIGSEFASKHECFLVLKDFVTITFSPDGFCYVNSTGNAGLAKFGSGDTLSGIIAGLTAQKPGKQSIYAAVFLHGLAADIAKEELSELGYTPLQLMHRLGKAITLVKKLDV